MCSTCPSVAPSVLTQRAYADIFVLHSTHSLLLCVTVWKAQHHFSPLTDLCLEWLMRSQWGWGTHLVWNVEAVPQQTPGEIGDSFYFQCIRLCVYFCLNVYVMFMHLHFSSFNHLSGSKWGFRGILAYPQVWRLCGSLRMFWVCPEVSSSLGTS